MKYRADIDGLRAIAVLAVVFFHADWEWFSGGYVGVDVFFVISGFLITGIILNELHEEKFSIARFYERRIRRIFPALYAVLAASTVAAYFLLFPDELVKFGYSALSIVFFSSNILFWRQTGYFNTPPESKPLLNTWSLAVEEQFYILYPIGLYLIWRWAGGRERTFTAIVAIAIASFLASTYGLIHHPWGTFYLTPTRAWELCLGGLLACGTLPSLPSRLQGLRETLALAGLLSIAWAACFFTIDTPFPGPNALFPCLGAALLIYTGISGTTLINRLISTPPFKFIGLISYSLYLWHWPMLAFYRTANIHLTTWQQSTAVVLLSILISTASWRWIEQPFRNKKQISKRSTIFTLGATTMAAATLAGLSLILLKGLPSRVPAHVHNILAAGAEPNPTPYILNNTPYESPPDKTAIVGTPGTPPTIALWGDSHALCLIPGLAETAQKHHTAIRCFVRPSNAPVPGLSRKPYNRQTLDILLNTPKLRTVILAARWPTYTEGRSGSLGPAEASLPQHPFLVDENNHLISRPEARKMLEKHLQESIRILLDAGKTIILIHTIPETAYTIPPTLARLSLQGQNPKNFTRPLSVYRKRTSHVEKILNNLPSHPRLIHIRPHTPFLKGDQLLVSNPQKGTSYYKDDNHLSAEGSRLVADLLPWDTLIPPAPDQNTPHPQ